MSKENKQQLIFDETGKEISINIEQQCRNRCFNVHQQNRPNSSATEKQIAPDDNVEVKQSSGRSVVINHENQGNNLAGLVNGGRGERRNICVDIVDKEQQTSDSENENIAVPLPNGSENRRIMERNHLRRIDNREWGSRIWNGNGEYRSLTERNNGPHSFFECAGRMYCDNEDRVIIEPNEILHNNLEWVNNRTCNGNEDGGIVEPNDARRMDLVWGNNMYIELRDALIFAGRQREELNKIAWGCPITLSDNAAVCGGGSNEEINSLARQMNGLRTNDNWSDGSANRNAIGKLANSDDTLHINDIPQCVLLKIFSYVPFEQRMANLLLVCKYWNVLGIDYSLFKDVTIAYERNPRLVARFIDKYHMLVWSISINVWSRYDLKKAMNSVMYCFNLRRLVICPLYIPPHEKNSAEKNKKITFDERTFDIPICDVIYALKTCKKLEELKMKYIRVLWPIGRVIQEISMYGSSLKKLSIKHYIGKSCPVPTEIYIFPRLEELRIDVADVALDFRTVENLLQSVSASLRVLKLYSRSYAVGNIMTNDLLSAISQCSLLERLTFKYPRWSFCKHITDVGFRKLFRLKYMRVLVLHCVDRISYQAFHDYFSLPYVKNFDKLEVINCSYFNDNIINLIKEKYPHLKYNGDGKFVRD